jgi:hypothetical protein
MVEIWVVAEVDASILPGDMRSHRVWVARFVNQIQGKKFLPESVADRSAPAGLPMILWRRRGSDTRCGEPRITGGVVGVHARQRSTAAPP